MPFVTSHTWSDGQILTAGSLNQNFTDLEGQIDGLTGSNEWILYSTSIASLVGSVDFTGLPFRSRWRIMWNRLIFSQTGTKAGLNFNGDIGSNYGFGDYNGRVAGDCLIAATNVTGVTFVVTLNN